jgi:hypothetical protein
MLTTRFLIVAALFGLVQGVADEQGKLEIYSDVVCIQKVINRGLPLLSLDMWLVQPKFSKFSYLETDRFRLNRCAG